MTALEHMTCAAAASLLLIVTATCSSERSQQNSSISARHDSQPIDARGWVLPHIELGANPTENLLTVLTIGITISEQAPDGETAGKRLELLLKRFDIDRLQKQALAAKGTLEAATDAQKDRLRSLIVRYKQAAEKWQQTSPTWTTAHRAWMRAWSD